MVEAMNKRVLVLPPGFKFGASGVSAAILHEPRDLIDDTERLLQDVQLKGYSTYGRPQTPLEQEASLIAKTELQLQGMPKRVKKKGRVGMSGAS